VNGGDGVWFWLMVIHLISPLITYLFKPHVQDEEN